MTYFITSFTFLSHVLGSVSRHDQNSTDILVHVKMCESVRVML